MKKISLLFTAVLALCTVYAQENLVPNPSFEEVEGKLKEGGMIEMAFPWKAVTMNPVDLYSADSKNDDFSVPNNGYGSEPANTGSNYAGVSFFGYGGRMPRTYLGVELTKELEEGKEYCMKFHVSLSDYSKYAVNNLAIYVDFVEMTEKTDGILKMVPQMKSIKNDPFEKQYLWTAVCGIYKAEGGEMFIAIGNFDADDRTTQTKLRLSKEFAGKRQQNNAYYYIDDVSVVELNDKTREDCLCDKIPGGRIKTEFKSFGTDESKKAEAQKTFIVNSDGTKADATVVEDVKEKAAEFSLENAVVYFGDKSTEPTAASMSTITKIVESLKADESLKIKVTGHSDPSEAASTSIDKKRAYAMKRKLVELGITADRIQSASAGTTKKVGEADKNRRATISIN